VQNGLDVVEVAQSYQPDIVFADILLQKKNGYEVCEEIKAHPDLRSTPVVLMWSSFMELDQKRYQSSGAQGELEKPFDVESMRHLIRELVQTTREQKIASYISFPQSIRQDFIEEEKQKAKAQPAMTANASAPGLKPPPAPMPTQEFKVEEAQFDIELDLEGDDVMGRVPSRDSVVGQNPGELVEVEEASQFNFQALDLDDEDSLPKAMDTSSGSATMPPPQEDEMFDESWAVRPLHPLPETLGPSREFVADDLEEFQSMDLQKGKKPKLDDFLYKPNFQFESPSDEPVQDSVQQQVSQVQINPNTEVSIQRMSIAEMEAIIRAEVRQVIQKTIAPRLSETLEKVVREELNRILQEEMQVQSQSSSPRS
jgi:CheY-like chemotaxis protein